MTSTYSRAAVRIAGLLLFAVSGLVSTGAQAQEYPSRPVKLMVGFAPGGATDQLGRLYAKRLSEKLGQPFVVENIGGAGGVIGEGRARPASIASRSAGPMRSSSVRLT